MDPAMEQAAAAPAAPPAMPASPDGDADAGQEDGAEDNSPLEKMEIEPAEDEGAIVTHHRKMSDRVKAMDSPETKPKKHVVKSHSELIKHIKKHAHRLQA